MSVLSAEAGKLICDALGIDPNGAREIHLHLVAGDLVHMEVHSTVQREALGNLVQIIKRFELTETASETVDTEPGGVVDTTAITDEVRSYAKAQINIALPGVTDEREAREAAAAVRREITNGAARDT
ncbi:hypothetical protein [Metapseudomonas resinovorans]|uniref:hypothetical protein n=1 Tax=Metapseudomonas resinovorans TaxID=53412 RepID=UPI000417692F|nr:hypothetical protein [Pseudomonas resinovorans]